MMKLNIDYFLDYSSGEAPTPYDNQKFSNLYINVANEIIACKDLWHILQPNTSGFWFTGNLEYFYPMLYVNKTIQNCINLNLSDSTYVNKAKEVIDFQSKNNLQMKFYMLKHYKVRSIAKKDLITFVDSKGSVSVKKNEIEYGNFTVGECYVVLVDIISNATVKLLINTTQKQYILPYTYPFPESL